MDDSQVIEESETHKAAKLLLGNSETMRRGWGWGHGRLGFSQQSLAWSLLSNARVIILRFSSQERFSPLNLLDWRGMRVKGSF